MKGMSIFAMFDPESEEDLSWGHKVCCPICGKFGQQRGEPKVYRNEKDEKAIGDIVKITIVGGECEHVWEIGIGFRAGNTFLFLLVAEDDYYESLFANVREDTINYYEYFRSEEWREMADAAKERVGYRCQVCNAEQGDGVILDAHHRTYERLGHELIEDITVLCRDCHGLYEHNKKIAQMQSPALPIRGAI